MARERDEHGRFIGEDGDDDVNGDPNEDTTQEPATEEPLAQDADAAPDTEVDTTDDDDDTPRDDDGNLIDPPVIPSHERELQEASATGDNDAVATVQERYTEAREDHVRRARERQGNDQ